MTPSDAPEAIVAQGYRRWQDGVLERLRGGLLGARLGSRPPRGSDRLRPVRLALDVRALRGQPPVLRIGAARALEAAADAARSRPPGGARVPVAVPVRAVADDVRGRPAAADGSCDASRTPRVARVLLLEAELRRGDRRPVRGTDRGDQAGDDRGGATPPRLQRNHGGRDERRSGFHDASRRWPRSSHPRACGPTRRRCRTSPTRTRPSTSSG